MAEGGISSGSEIADEVLFPAALATDVAETVPVELLDALADAGFYGLSGPSRAGGLEADFFTVCGAIEALAGGCLTTTFVWAQHLGAVFRAATSPMPGIEEAWLEPLCRGTRRAGLAAAGVLPGRRSFARSLSRTAGSSTAMPAGSAAGAIDIVHTAARPRTECGLGRSSTPGRVRPLRRSACGSSASTRAPP